MEKSLNNRFPLGNKFRDPYNFEEIINDFDFIIKNVKELDFSNIKFIEPYSMIFIILLGRNYLRKRGEKLKLINIPLNVHQYLARMDFFKTGIFEISKELNKKLYLKRSTFSSRVIEIIEIPNKERESIKVISGIIDVFRKRASHILKYWINDFIIDFFVIVISELCQNIFEHSLDSGYIAMQTYSMDRKNIVRLVISDSGIGIKQSFQNKNDLVFESDAKLIQMALTTPISSKREFGYGLCQVNSIVEKLKGTIYLRSGKSSVTAMHHKKSKGSSYMFQKNDLNYFNGTQISITLSN